MAARKTPSTPEIVPAAAVGTEPAPYSGHHDHSFTLQAVMELQKSVGSLDAALRANTAAIEKLDARMDRMADRMDARIGNVEYKLSGITKKIYAATVILAILVAVGAFVVDKAWDMAATHLVEISKAAVSQKGK